MGKIFAVIFICGNLFLRIAEKNAKLAKIRTRKNFVPHDSNQNLKNKRAVLATKPVHFVLLADSFIVLSANLLKPQS